jgi:hypothetical protein
MIRREGQRQLLMDEIRRAICQLQVEPTACATYALLRLGHRMWRQNAPYSLTVAEVEELVEREFDYVEGLA